MYPSKRRARQQASRASSAAVRRDDARRRAVPHLFRPLKREKNRGIYDRAASRQEGKKKKRLLKLLLPNFFGKNLRRKEPRKEEVEEKEEEGAYYARTILTKVSHRAPLGRRDQTIVPPCASRARAHAAVAFRTYTYIRRTR